LRTGSWRATGAGWEFEGGTEWCAEELEGKGKWFEEEVECAVVGVRFKFCGRSLLGDFTLGRKRE
jgi:hypothetical protein